MSKFTSAEAYVAVRLALDDDHLHRFGGRIHIASVAAPSQTSIDLAPRLAHHISVLDFQRPTTPVLSTNIVLTILPL
ncbi:hypothetical protein RSOLAG1IB_01726 [Rhizoctonia solani AG-1 IB]|uniref:Uncharacterized protein n=1 Tax=Thanatephorus cucumeris (strain AG1-IB / isolate 7/3/14) TaxID=1108050 RepID=A0A0B7FFP3_THACB|nr:hypothetical protein RSOLAG1IB_01726 [Rhizoctonia solani AG-1 IB]